MLTVERIKELLDDSAITDAEAEAIRDGFRALVEDVIFQSWMSGRDKNTNLNKEK